MSEAKTATTISLPASWVTPLRVYAAQQGMRSFSAVVSAALREYAKAHGIELPGVEDEDSAGADDSEPQGKRPAA